jgi:hypothetical protein
MSKQAQGSSKDNKAYICTNCKKKGHTKEQCWLKGGGQEGQGPKQRRNQKPKKKKGKEKAHTVEEDAGSSDEDNDVAFMNHKAIFLSKDSSGVTHILDTGASAHMTPHKNLLKDYKVFEILRCISAANKGVFNALGAGTLVLLTHTKGNNNKIILKNTLYAPDITFTLISIGKCDDAGYKTTFTGQQCTIMNKSGTILLKAPKYHGLYRVDQRPAKLTAYTCLNPFEMHKRLGHISQKSIKMLFDQGMILGLKLKTTKDKIVCDACIKSKIMRKPLPKESRERTKAVGERVYMDVWGPARNATIDHKYYYISFTDDYSRESVIYLMKNKSEAFEKYKLYEAMMKR